MKKSPFYLLAPVLALAALTACGGGKTESTTTTTQSQTAAPAGNSMAGGAMTGATAPVPATLHCGATAPVWANTKSHVYHLASDPMYGKTKHGQYMCAQTAVAQGYHAAGSKAGGAMEGGKRKHHKSGSMMQAQPQPSPT